jgi:hypothetical protein
MKEFRDKFKLCKDIAGINPSCKNCMYYEISDLFAFEKGKISIHDIVLKFPYCSMNTFNRIFRVDKKYIYEITRFSKRWFLQQYFYHDLPSRIICLAWTIDKRYFI